MSSIPSRSSNNSFCAHMALVLGLSACNLALSGLPPPWERCCITDLMSGSFAWASAISSLDHDAWSCTSGCFISVVIEATGSDWEIVVLQEGQSPCERWRCGLRDNASALPWSLPGLCSITKPYSCKRSIHLATCPWGSRKFSNHFKAWWSVLIKNCRPSK